MENMKRNNICIMGTSEGEECKQQIKNLFEEIITENLTDLVKEKDTQVQGAQRFPNKLDLKRLTPRNIIIKMTRLALAGVAQSPEHRPAVTSSSPSKGTCLSCGPGPQWRPYERQPHIDVSLPLFPSV